MYRSFRLGITSALAFAAGLTAAGAASATPYDTLASIAGAYNMFLLGSLGTASSPYASTIQGPIAVAGNVYSSGATIDSSAAGSAAEIVGGSLSQAGGAVDGNVFVGGAAANFSGVATVTGSVSMTATASTLTYGLLSPTPNGIYVTPTTTVNEPFYMNSAVHTSGGPTTPIAFSGTSADLLSASTALGGLGANAFAQTGGTLTVTLASNGLNVVNLVLPDGATVNGINIVTATGVTPTGVVLNVSGNNLKFTGGAYTTGSLANSAVLYNFSNATNLSFNSLAFEGNLLAPLATVAFTNGRVDGSVIAGNFVGANTPLSEQGFNDPLPTYVAGVTTAAVSEPASLFVFLLPLGLMAVGRKSSSVPSRNG